MEGVRPGPAGPDVVAETAGALWAPAAAGHQVLEQRLDAGELRARRRIVREVGAEEKRVRQVADLRLLRVEQLRWAEIVECHGHARVRASASGGHAVAPSVASLIDDPPQAMEAWADSRSSDVLMIRETCICEQPIAAAICHCLRSCWKRMRSTSRARGSRIEVSRSIVFLASARSYSASSRPITLPIVAGSGSASTAVLSSERGTREAWASTAALTAACGRSRRSASSATVGSRPSTAPNFCRSLSTRRLSSMSPRGGRTIHVVSLKYRRSSPRIVGTAYEENAYPISGSQRSTILTSASEATWIRSSGASPDQR